MCNTELRKALPGRGERGGRAPLKLEFTGLRAPRPHRRCIMHDDEKGKVIRGSTLGRFIHDSIWVSSRHRYAGAATTWRDSGSCAAPTLRAVPGCPLLWEVLLDALTGEGFSHTCDLRPLTCVGTMLGVGAAASGGGANVGVWLTSQSHVPLGTTWSLLVRSFVLKYLIHLCRPLQTPPVLPWSSGGSPDPDLAPFPARGG